MLNRIYILAIYCINVNINWAAAWFDILTSVDSGEPLQPPFKLRNSKWYSIGSLTLIDTQASSKGSDQTARMRRLIWGFAGRTYHNVGNPMHWLNSNQLPYISRNMDSISCDQKVIEYGQEKKTDLCCFLDACKRNFPFSWLLPSQKVHQVISKQNKMRNIYKPKTNTGNPLFNDSFCPKYFYVKLK